MPTLFLFVFILIVFLGTVVYTGFTSFAQEELQKATGTAALIGASSLWDGDTLSTPTKSDSRAVQAAQAVWGRHVLNSSLQGMNATITNVSVNDDRLSISSEAVVPLGFLNPIGISALRVQAEATAQYVVESVAGFPANVRQAGCGNPGQLQAVGALRSPLVDRPGPDLLVEVGNRRGYHVLACTTTVCHDISGAARVLGNGRLRRGNKSGQQYTSIYGSAVIDLAALSSTYNGNVVKATSIHIVDDQISDTFDPGGVRFYEFCPGPVQVNRVLALHHAQLCNFGGTICNRPPGFIPSPF